MPGMASFGNEPLVKGRKAWEELGALFLAIWCILELKYKYRAFALVHRFFQGAHRCFAGFHRFVFFSQWFKCSFHGYRFLDGLSWFIHFSTFAYFCPMVLIEYSMNLSFLPSFLPSLVIVFSDPYSCFVWSIAFFGCLCLRMLQDASCKIDECSIPAGPLGWLSICCWEIWSNRRTEWSAWLEGDSACASAHANWWPNTFRMQSATYIGRSF